jgi:hypothetical protein
MSSVSRVDDPSLPSPWQALYDSASRLKVRLKMRG